MVRTIEFGDWKLGGGTPFFFVSGPCVIESRQHCLELAARLKEIADRLRIAFFFKASYDKANRTSISSYRGPGLEEGLRILSDVKTECGVPIWTDVHDPEQVAQAAEVADVLQVPAFLSRQTDLLLAAAASGRIVNVKKGQFLSPWDVQHVVGKLEATGCSDYFVTERGVSFGYNNLVVDFKALPIIRSFGCPVVFDATHSVQLPGGDGGASGGQSEFIAHLARAAVAVGVDGLFFEVHDHPEKALSDGPNALHLQQVEPLLKSLQRLEEVVKEDEIEPVGSGSGP